MSLTQWLSHNIEYTGEVYLAQIQESTEYEQVYGLSGHLPVHVVPKFHRTRLELEVIKYENANTTGAKGNRQNYSIGRTAETKDYVRGLKPMAVFQFSIELKGNLNPLKSWLDHFEETGTPAGLVELSGASSIWRAGQRRGLGEKTDKPVGTLKIWVNGFDRYWLEAGGKVGADDLRRVGWGE